MNKIYGLWVKKFKLWHFITSGDKLTLETLKNDITTISPDFKVVIKIIKE